MPVRSLPNSIGPFEEGRPGRPRPRRRTGWTVAGILGSALAGIAVVFCPASLVIGAVVCTLAVYLVLTRPFIGLLLYTLTFALRPAEVYPSLGPLHVERIIGALALAAMYMEQQRRSKRLSVDATRQTRLLLLLALPILLSVPFAYVRSRALNGFVDFLKLLAWYLLVVQLLDRQRRLRIFVVLFLALVCYIAFDALYGYTHGSVAFRMGIQRAVGQTDAGGDPNTLAATMSATIPLLILLAFHRPLRWMRAVPAVVAVLLSIIVGVTGSRSGLLGFLGGLSFLWWRARHRLPVALVAGALLIFGFVVLPQQYKTRYSTITEGVAHGTFDGSSLGRFSVWKKGLRMIMDRPLTGVGIDCFGVANAAAYSEEGRASYLQAHSLYVQVPAEIGLPGAIIFFAFLVEAIRLNRNVRRKLTTAGRSGQFEVVVLHGMAAGFFALLVTGIFGHSFMRYTWYVYAGLGAAMARTVGEGSATPA